MEVMFNSFESRMKCTCFVTSKYSRISYIRKQIFFFMGRRYCGRYKLLRKVLISSCILLALRFHDQFHKDAL